MLGRSPVERGTGSLNQRGVRVALVTLVVAELLACCAGGAGYLAWETSRPVARPAPSVTSTPNPPPAPTPAPSASRPPRVAVVTYEVSGTGRVDINYADPSRAASVILLDQPLPWRVDLPRQPVGFVSITASREDGPPHSVRVLIDGVEFCGSTSRDGFDVAACMELVPPD
jgi:hypothetical protein